MPFYNYGFYNLIQLAPPFLFSIIKRKAKLLRKCEKRVRYRYEQYSKWTYFVLTQKWDTEKIRKVRFDTIRNRTIKWQQCIKYETKLT